jgi:hypothetical protein
MISVQRGRVCRETFENPADLRKPYLYKPTQSNRVALESVFASCVFVCVCVCVSVCVCACVRASQGRWGGDFHNYISISELPFEYASRKYEIFNSKENWICMKRLTEGSNKKPSDKLNLIHEHFGRIVFFIRYFSWMWTFITPSNEGPEKDGVWGMIGRIF